ncbi:benzoate-CoA ligase family protein [Ovoidimarina sediminis]|uniref:benzoate-CoA ligase family protein n=1 Tax=Ovoidimarina sediminis TaxID=3079856 RepID=UPI00290805B1|nr:benzoate-CoA ligase family protein [Rhodophyticola sp. MJ-SS7]MDU8943131.1 benzoate-CoA ligase family protein [Rhodophyticola sp. MJ-SS7]
MGNAARYFVDRHLEEGRGDKPAFIEAGESPRTLTYGDLAHQSACLAGALVRAGYRQEDRALMLCLDTLEFPVIFWGAMRAGIIPVPLNNLLATPVYGEILADSRASILFVSAPLWPVIEPVIGESPLLREIVVIGGAAPEGTVAHADFIAGAPAAPPAEASDDEVAFWLYSSGSTGRPKGVKHVHAALKATADTYGAKTLQIREDDTVFSAAKLFFAYGLGNAMTFPMSVGATAILYPGRPTPETVSAVIGTQKPTIYCGVPTLYAALLHHWEAAAPPEAPIRTCISAGEALPEEVGRKWAALWGTDIMDGVGSTEMLHIFLSNAPGDVVYGTSGTAVPGYELRLVDEDGAEVAPGEVGELLVRGASAAEGYWNQRGKSRATFEGEWTRTGDKYERRADGRFVYCGRTDDMFKVSGIWVSPFEVEQALASHPAVLESAVVAHRDEDGLEKPKAFIVLKDRAFADRAETLREHVKERIGKWKYPRWIEIVDDLPKTATGKIQRFRLREGR